MPFNSPPLLSSPFGHFSLFLAPPQPFSTLILSSLPSPAVVWCYLLSHGSSCLTLWCSSSLFIATVRAMQTQKWTKCCTLFSYVTLGSGLCSPGPHRGPCTLPTLTTMPSPFRSWVLYWSSELCVAAIFWLCRAEAILCGQYFHNYCV